MPFLDRREAGRLLAKKLSGVRRSSSSCSVSTVDVEAVIERRSSSCECAATAATPPQWRRSERLRCGQCQAGQRARGWLLGCVSFVDLTALAAPRTNRTGRRGLIGAWHRPH
jgi:hypothetical protein